MLKSGENDRAWLALEFSPISCPRFRSGPLVNLWLLSPLALFPACVPLPPVLRKPADLRPGLRQPDVIPGHRLKLNIIQSGQVFAKDLLVFGLHRHSFYNKNKSKLCVMDDSGAQSPREIPIIVPHADHGDAECCGCLMPVVRGDQTYLVCNECGAVIRSVPANEAGQAIAALERFI